MNRKLILIFSLLSIAGVASAAGNRTGPTRSNAPSGPVHNAANDAYKKAKGTDNPLPKPAKPTKPSRPAAPING